MYVDIIYENKCTEEHATDSPLSCLAIGVMPYLAMVDEISGSTVIMP